VAGTLASVLLIFIVAIAAYALWLRIDQYGWTVDRIDTAAVTLIAICFAIGYFVAALLPGKWLKLIETWNFFTTILGLIVLFALFTPIADPVRLSVANQVERLNSGKVKPDGFDFSYLRWQGGRFGRDALTALAKSKTQTIRNAVAATLKPIQRSRGTFRFQGSPGEMARAIKVHPSGKTLPASFLNQDWPLGDISFLVGSCVHEGFGLKTRCDAVVRDFDGDGVDDILVVSGTEGTHPSWNAQLFRWNGKRWERLAMIPWSSCESDRAALIAGNFKLVSLAVPLPDILVGEKRIHLGFAAAQESGGCQ
jgi:hypothetical protein